MKEINVFELKNKLEEDQNKKILLVDVREFAEHEEEHIENSKLFPTSEITEEKIKELIKETKDKEIILYCKSGMRSQNALNKFLCCNVENVCILKGGIDSWKSQNFNTKKKASIISLDRQVQLVLGILILLFSLLSIFISKIFLIFLIFISCGLIFAGSTGKCGLAILLARMPFNKK